MSIFLTLLSFKVQRIGLMHLSIVFRTLLVHSTTKSDSESLSVAAPWRTSHCCESTRLLPEDVELKYVLLRANMSADSTTGLNVYLLREK